ncbi:hypothetical protein AG1IA_06570 [Rhizoctonia solani AG-1 IA]|uniref:Uncharacterized protein n=1 Tax=Thanatephorus cucumeris (strain AG1-IA) TaxID=983506 RepID=L8WRN0_THACA|nr:hypothetical protein AG1IA_06570 [Rhizoctonia solani AG-1 IA]
MALSRPCIPVSTTHFEQKRGILTQSSIKLNCTRIYRVIHVGGQGSELLVLEESSESRFIHRLSLAYRTTVCIIFIIFSDLKRHECSPFSISANRIIMLNNTS